jgi:formylglycine-generating enzyme required for sulfatase activity
MGTNPSSFKGANLPVEQVSWFDAVEFCNARSRKEGLTPAYSVSDSGDSRNVTWNHAATGYRLPTEAEWEYAARGGNGSPGNYTYAGSNTVGDVAWYEGNSGITHRSGLQAEISVDLVLLRKCLFLTI